MVLEVFGQPAAVNIRLVEMVDALKSAAFDEFLGVTVIIPEQGDDLRIPSAGMCGNGMIAGHAAEHPLAGHAGGVTGLLEKHGQCFFQIRRSGVPQPMLTGPPAGHCFNCAGLREECRPVMAI